MISEKSLIRLPRGQELRSNNLKDIQEYMDRFRQVLDDTHRQLVQDIGTIQVDADGFIYFGGQDTDGSWRIGRDGADWTLDHLESGTWVNASKQKAT